MTQHVSQEDVLRIAHYARIALSPEELPTLARDLNAIIDSLDIIHEYDLEGVEPTFHPIGGVVNVMREDVVGNSFEQERALENAPRKQDGYFVIPSILSTGDN